MFKRRIHVIRLSCKKDSSWACLRTDLEAVENRALGLEKTAGTLVHQWGS